MGPDEGQNGAGPFEFDTGRKCFHLREGYKFHLLISHPPCGDACITAAAECGTDDCNRFTPSHAEMGAADSCRTPAQTPAQVPDRVPACGTGAKRLVPSAVPQHNAGVLHCPVINGLRKDLHHGTATVL